MKNIKRKDALSLLSKLDSASLSFEERQVLIDLKMLLLERQDLEDACMADLNSYKAWTVWDGKQDVLDRNSTMTLLICLMLTWRMRRNPLWMTM